MESEIPQTAVDANLSAETLRENGADCLRQGKFAEAADALGAATRIDPSDEGAWRLLGGAFAAQGDYSRAVVAFQHAIALAPTNARNYYNSGLALEALDHTGAARAAFESALRIDPNYEAAQARLTALGTAAYDIFEPASSSAPSVAPNMPGEPVSAPVEQQPLPTAGHSPMHAQPIAQVQEGGLSSVGFAPEPTISAFPPASPGYVPQPVLGAVFDAASNNSGMREAPPPEVATGWNWGAFYLNWLWLLNHKRVGWGMGFLGVAFVHFLIGRTNHTNVGSALKGIITLTELGAAIYLGVKGNEIGWKYRRFLSVADFRACQKIWAKWSLGLFLTYVVCIVLLIVLVIVLGMLGIAAMSGAAKAL